SFPLRWDGVAIIVTSTIRVSGTTPRTPSRRRLLHVKWFSWSWISTRQPNGLSWILCLVTPATAAARLHDRSQLSLCLSLPRLLPAALLGQLQAHHRRHHLALRLLCLQQTRSSASTQRRSVAKLRSTN